MNNISQRPHPSIEQSGFLLIEVLITIAILSIGLLGVSAMLSLSLKSGNAAIERGEIAMVMSSMAGRMRANTPAAIAVAQHYNVTDKSAIASCNMIDNPTTEAEVAANDLCLWMSDLKAVLGVAQQPTGSINCNANHLCSYTVTWHDNASKSTLESEYDAENTAINRSYTYTTTVMF